MDHYGIISILPLVVFLVLAIWTKQLIFSTIIAGITGYIIEYKTGFVQPTIDHFIEALTDSDNMWIVLVCMLFGCLIYLLREAKGTVSFGNFARRYANTQKKSLMTAWVMGLIIFIDDYLSILTTANTIMPLTDEQKTPREMLTYVINTTSAPVCVIIPISAWVVFFSGIFEAQPETKVIADTGTQIYYSIMPYFFYPFLCVLFVPLVILGIVPKMGNMKKAYKRVADTGQLWPDSSAVLNKAAVMQLEQEKQLAGSTSQMTQSHEVEKELMEAEKDQTGDIRRIWTFILPMAVVIAVTIWKGDILIGVIAGIITCFLFIPTKVLSFKKFCNASYEGIQDMLYVGVLLISLLFYRNSMLLIGLPEFVIEVVEPFMVASLLPAITFVLVGLLCFATGSIWSIPALTTPIVVPLAVSVGADLPLTLGAIVSAAIFGAQACFYSDVTVMSSTACKVNNIDYGIAQIPYVIIVTIISIVMFVVAGFIL